MESVNIFHPEEHVRKIKMVQRILAPYYERLIYIKSLKQPKIVVKNNEVIYDYGEDTPEEKHVLSIIASTKKKYLL